ncbi:MAG TPA: nitric-oxide reductase large subunit, partial [Marinobacter sp.]|nr:nitric-oxide reductase large subunit [Marinobacter sp.]
MAEFRKLWWVLIAVLALTFSILGYFGAEVYRSAPPIPDRVVTTDGNLLMTEDSILDGQTAWQSVGGLQLGSIWGHGAYQAPDWTADWLHRELLNWLDLAAVDTWGQLYESLTGEQQHALRYRLAEAYRTNTYNRDTGTLVLSDRRAEAIRVTAAYYDRLFGNDPAMQPTRENYAMKENTLPNPERRARMAEFFFWTAWAAATERPGQEVTYTNNWPHEPLINNKPTAENIVW